MVVSYGGHGGGKCNAHLREVLAGLHMVTTKTTVELTFPGREFMVMAARGKDLNLDGATDSGVWNAERKTLSEAFAELLELLSADIVALATNATLDPQLINRKR
jgi:NAD(P)H-dependent FMN reductase